MDPRELKLISRNEGKKKGLIVTHLTIRQSITFLILKLFLIELMAAGAIVVFHSFFIYTNISELARNADVSFQIFNVPIYIFLVIFKTLFTIYIITLWLNEYYEITSTEILHRSGFFIKREQRYQFEHLGSVDLDQSFFGRIFNYGSLKFYNWALEKEISMYLIHNPNKYYLILKKLLPETDREKKIFREHIIEEDET